LLAGAAECNIRGPAGQGRQGDSLACNFDNTGNIVDTREAFGENRQLDDLQELEATADCLEALGNSTRLAIYRMLVKAGPEGMPVGAIQEALAIPASTLTHHLNRLLWVGLIGQQRNGRQLLCSANFDCLHAMLNFVERECCQGNAWPAATATPERKAARRQRLDG
jgi:hypothetical protein